MLKRSDARRTFSLSGQDTRIVDRYIVVPGGRRPRLQEAPRFRARMVGSTLSLKAGRWSDALTMEFERQRQPPPPDTHAGVRLSAREHWPQSGARTTARSPQGGGPGQLLVEMGERLAYAHRLLRLRRLSKDVWRKMKGSHNRRKAIRRLWRHQTRMANLRREVLHKLTTEIVRRAASIGIEALTDVFKNGRVFRAIAELGVYEFRRQPEYLRRRLRLPAPRGQPHGAEGRQPQGGR